MPTTLFRRSLVALIGAAALASACGARQPSDDPICDPGARAYGTKPLFAKCSDIRTHEMARDPRTGKSERFHRLVLCCE